MRFFERGVEKGKRKKEELVGRDFIFFIRVSLVH